MNKADVIILGGGLVGASVALALDAHGITSIVVDPADPGVTLSAGFDGRASALASASQRMLDAIGVGTLLAGQGCPIEAIRVSDGLAPGALDFMPGADAGALGFMYENRHVRQALHLAASRAGGVDMHLKTRATAVERGPGGVVARLSSGAQVFAQLLIVAEGRNSPTRMAAGINIVHWSYRHNAIICAFEHERPHENTAFEIFYPAGPFAILPLLPVASVNRSALVWTVAERHAQAMLKLSARAFLAEAEKAMGGFLGELSGLGPRSTYPLGFHNAARITGERLALVGDAAHGIHPIAGQGLNLGFRDVATIAQVLVEGKRMGLDLGDPQLLARYERWRGGDTLTVALATDGLTRLFGLPGKTASAVRRFGLSAVQALPPLKSRFMAEARGESGDLPRLLQGELV